MFTSSLVYVGIAPHPPIMVPEVGREHVAEVRGSVEAMRELTERIVASGAQTVVLISPHAPLDARAFVAYHETELRGDFANFRAPQATIAAPLDAELLETIMRAAGEDGFEVAPIHDYEVDHGTAVPLYFLLRNGWRGRVVALGYSFLSNEAHIRFGESLRRAVEEVARPVAFIASGDLSHRLKPEAPAGYNPDAHLFDEEVVASIRDCAPRRIAWIDQDLRRLAGECGYRSMLVALGACDGLEPDCEVLHYEAPFGVGYLVAQLARAASADTARRRAEAFAASSDDSAASGEDLPAFARRAVETYAREGRIIKPPAANSPLLRQRAACFVSIKTDDGGLRGCIGTIEPAHDNLAEELMANAIAAATRDPRFPPISAEELPSLRYSVDILAEAVPAEFADLDPKTYGVIVEDERGRRRGLLLPDIEGVDTARQQVQIAARKAGISSNEPVRLYRFHVRRFSEPPSSNEPTE